MSISENFNLFLSKTEVAFCVVTDKGAITEANSAFYQASGLQNRGDAKLKDIVEAKGSLGHFLKKATAESKASLEVCFKLAERDIYAIANASLISDKSAKELLIGIVFTEVTKQKDLEDKLEEKIAIEVEKNRQKDEMMNQQAKLATMGEMIGNIAHQWRQPLNILALVFQDIYIKYQLNGLDAEQMEKNYEKVNNLLQYMSQTIDDFRTFFKDEDADVAFDLRDAIDGVFGLMGTRFITNNTECKIHIEGNPTIFGTENGFKQVIINLLNNAQEAILAKKPKKGIIEIFVEADKKLTVISVSDNGGGVPKKIMNQIFEPYFTTKHQTQGTGLGLYMSKQIIEHHMNGKLEVSNSDKGAVFKISLPLV